MLGKAVSPQPGNSSIFSKLPVDWSSLQMAVPCCRNEKLTRSIKWCSQGGKVFRRGLSWDQNGPPGSVLATRYRSDPCRNIFGDS